jgi:hypothetical protein
MNKIHQMYGLYETKLLRFLRTYVILGKSLARIHKIT